MLNKKSLRALFCVPKRGISWQKVLLMRDGLIYNYKYTASVKRIHINRIYRTATEGDKIMGNIIGMLAGELMSGSSVKQVAKAAGVNEKQAENLMGNAIPLLVQAMSDNAGTKVGAESLHEALGQHSNGLSAAEQLDRADLEDGDRIIGKILGDNKQGVTEALAKQAGITKGNSAKILALLAPVILSLISTETNTNNTSSGGLSSLLSLFTDDDTGHSNTQTTSSSGLGDIGTALLMGALLGNNNNGNSGSAGGNLLTSLLGGGQQQVQPQQQSGYHCDRRQDQIIFYNFFVHRNYLLFKKQSDILIFHRVAILFFLLPSGSIYILPPF